MNIEVFTSIPRMWRGSLLALATAACLLTTHPAQAAAVTPFKILPGDAVIGPAYHDQQSPSLACGENIFLAVWADRRAGGSGSDIYGARLDANGQPLDTVPFVITQAPGDQVRPRAVWNGLTWLVVWQSQEPTAFYWACQAMGARVSAQGVVLDPTPIPITAYQNAQSLMFTAASDGTNWLVVAEGGSAGEAAVLGFLVSPLGAVLNPGGTVILPETYYMRYGLEAGFAGSEYLFLWTEWNAVGLDDVYAFRLSPNCQSLDPSPIVVAASTDYDVQPRIASNGTNFFVVYERYNNCCGQGGRVYGTRVTQAGVVQDLAGLDVSGDVGITTGRHAGAAWDGANWSVTWAIPSVCVAQVSAAGVVLSRGGQQIDGGFGASKEEPEIASAPGGGTRVVWTDYRAGGSNPRDVFTAGVSPSGIPAAGACLSVGAPAQLTPRLASLGNGALAVFLSAVSGGQRVLAQRLDVVGNPLDAQPFEIAPLGAGISSPAVAANGSMYLVVWENRATSTVYGKRVQTDGTVIDASPIPLMPGSTPDVAAVGDVFLVVDTHAPSNPEFRFTYSRRLRASDGALLDPAPTLIGGSFALNPRVAAFNDRWLVVWETHPTHDDPTANVYARFVGTSGAPSPQFAITDDGYYVRFHYRPAIAANGTNALVAWTDPRFGNTDWNIFARRVLADGSVLDAEGPPPAPLPPLTMPATYPGFALTTAPNNQDRPALAWSGQDYFAAWQDTRANLLFFDQRTDVFGARSTAGGVLIETNGIPLGSSGLPEVTPALTGMNGTVLYALSTFQDQPPYAAYRVAVGVLTTPATRPTLRITRAGQNLLLAWPTNAAGYRLETSALDAPSLTWGPANPPPIPNESDFTVTIPLTGNGALFRLVTP